jgi:translation elongation factor EF-4
MRDFDYRLQRITRGYDFTDSQIGDDLEADLANLDILINAKSVVVFLSIVSPLFQTYQSRVGHL